MPNIYDPFAFDGNDETFEIPCPWWVVPGCPKPGTGGAVDYGTRTYGIDYSNAEVVEPLNTAELMLSVQHLNAAHSSTTQIQTTAWTQYDVSDLADTGTTNWLVNHDSIRFCVPTGSSWFNVINSYYTVSGTVEQSNIGGTQHTYPVTPFSGFAIGGVHYEISAYRLNSDETKTVTDETNWSGKPENSNPGPGDGVNIMTLYSGYESAYNRISGDYVKWYKQQYGLSTANGETRNDLLSKASVRYSTGLLREPHDITQPDDPDYTGFQYSFSLGEWSSIIRTQADWNDFFQPYTTDEDLELDNNGVCPLYDCTNNHAHWGATNSSYKPLDLRYNERHANYFCYAPWADYTSEIDEQSEYTWWAAGTVGNYFQANVNALGESRLRRQVRPLDHMGSRTVQTDELYSQDDQDWFFARLNPNICNWPIPNQFDDDSGFTHYDLTVIIDTVGFVDTNDYEAYANNPNHYYYKYWPLRYASTGSPAYWASPEIVDRITAFKNALQSALRPMRWKVTLEKLPIHPDILFGSYSEIDFSSYDLALQLYPEGSGEVGVQFATSRFNPHYSGKRIFLSGTSPNISLVSRTTGDWSHYPYNLFEWFYPSQTVDVGQSTSALPHMIYDWANFGSACGGGVTRWLWDGALDTEYINVNHYTLPDGSSYRDAFNVELDIENCSNFTGTSTSVDTDLYTVYSIAGGVVSNSDLDGVPSTSADTINFVAVPNEVTGVTVTGIDGTSIFPKTYPPGKHTIEFEVNHLIATSNTIGHIIGKISLTDYGQHSTDETLHMLPSSYFATSHTDTISIDVESSSQWRNYEVEYNAVSRVMLVAATDIQIPYTEFYKRHRPGYVHIRPTMKTNADGLSYHFVASSDTTNEIVSNTECSKLYSTIEYSGVVGYANTFDTSPGSYIGLDSPIYAISDMDSDDHTKEYTVAVWVKPSNISPDDYYKILSYGDSGDHTGPNQLPNFGITDSEISIGYSGDDNFTYTLPTDEWSHIVWVKRNNDISGGLVDLYVNGQLHDTEPMLYSEINFSASNYQTVAPKIGHEFSGMINDLRVYSKVLSKNEIYDLSKAKVLDMKFNNSNMSDGQTMQSGITMDNPVSEYDIQTYDDYDYTTSNIDWYSGETFGYGYISASTVGSEHNVGVTLSDPYSVIAPTPWNHHTIQFYAKFDNPGAFPEADRKNFLRVRDENDSVCYSYALYSGDAAENNPSLVYVATAPYGLGRVIGSDDSLKYDYIDVDDWHLYTITHESLSGYTSGGYEYYHTFKGYVDGEHITTDTYKTLNQEDGSQYSGPPSKYIDLYRAYSPYTGVANGELASLKIWKTVLSAADVKREYERIGSIDELGNMSNIQEIDEVELVQTSTGMSLTRICSFNEFDENTMDESENYVRISADSSLHVSRKISEV